ncbi:hypothetical protein ABID26_000566 [Mesorhizobium shonense]|uniref:Uncharacterized protein n=1 Tax=Mesorhizobium shonense TaxID=1209948 RepID=A0ABV2HLX9_9HYPH
MMRTLVFFATLSLLAGPASASDHLFTAVGAGGLTTASQPFQNGTDNPGRPGTSVAGEGSPLSGDEHTVPATETATGATSKTPPSADQGKTAPSGRAR